MSPVVLQNFIKLGTNVGDRLITDDIFKFHMVEEVATEVATNLPIDLLSTGIVAGTGVAVSEFRSYLSRDTISVNLGEVSLEFHEALEAAIEEENERLDTKELGGFTDNWPAIAEELADTPTAPDTDTRRDAEEVDILFVDEQQAVTQIAEAYATVEDIPLDRMPQAREAIQDALIRAYRRAVEDFKDRIDGTELERQLQRETGLVLAERLVDLKDRLTVMEADVEHILTQEAHNERFRQFSQAFFARQPTSPEDCWRVEFSLADVEAGIPAEREGLDDSPASEELLEILRTGENRIVVGRPGSGKSTLCKQAAVRWFEDDELGDVLYRETGTGSPFTSTDALKQAIDRAHRPVLIVVEDAVRDQSNSIAETIEEFGDADGVRFLLDARKEELDAFETTGSLDVSADRRRGSVLQNVTQYPLPTLSEADVEQVCEAFTESTGREVHSDPEKLYDDLQMEAENDLGIGEMLLLAFFLPSTDDQQDATSLEAHVRARFETLNPEGEESIRDLSKFDTDLLAEVGAMVNLLNACSIGIHQELVHALAYKHDHDIETHDTIEEILRALVGWVLFPNDGEGPTWQTHPLWSTLYLRERALDHADQQASSRRRDRSDPRAGQCLESLFRLFDDEKHRDALMREFPRAPELESIEEDPVEQADEYLRMIFEILERWPVLAPLFGTTETSGYELPEMASKKTTKYAITQRGHAYRLLGSYSKSKTEYEFVLKQSREQNDIKGVATSLDSIGMTYLRLGETDQAREYLQEALEIMRQIDDRQGEAGSLSNLALILLESGKTEQARKYLHESLEISKELDDRHAEATILNNIGDVYRSTDNHEKARKYLQESLDICRELGDRHNEAWALGNLGAITLELKDLKQARRYLQQSLEIHRKTGDRRGESQSLNSLGLTVFITGQPEQAREYLQQSLDIFRELGDRRDEAHALINLGMVADTLGENDDAREYYNSACEVSQQNGTIEKELVARLSLINLEVDANEPQDARKHCEAVFECLDEHEGELPDGLEQLEELCDQIPDNA